MRNIKFTVGLLVMGWMGGFLSPAYSGTYSKDVMLHGAVETTKISGFRGTAFTLQDDNPDHAIYGIQSKERGDQPCWVLIRTENINDHTDDAGGATKDLCGEKATSSLLKVEYTDFGLNEPRIFVRGVRVCMNSKGTRVKGLQILGRKITDDGKPMDLTLNEPLDFLAGGGSGGVPNFPDPTAPKDQRSNCNKDE
ncbi:MAG: hypothetical protein OET79_11290, partial [Nitrospirota bacterium]|nr:hypothetical protein [Nitrospirota bacterium]